MLKTLSSIKIGENTQKLKEIEEYETEHQENFQNIEKEEPKEKDQLEGDIAKFYTAKKVLGA